MFKIKKGDIVVVRKGADKGKKGKVLGLFEQRKKALVEGINMKKKHTRATRQDQKGGIKSIEAPVSVSNLMLFCKQCNKEVRVGVTILKDGTKSRTCKKCKEAL